MNALSTNDDIAKMRAEKEMLALANKLGMPHGLPQLYYVIPIKKEGRVTHYEGRWGKYGLLWIAHQLGDIAHIECRNLLRAKQNNGLSTAFCRLAYTDGRISIEEGEADIQERNIQINPGGPYKQADTMARVRALEHAIVNISANGSLLAMDRPLDKPVVYEVKHGKRESSE